MELSEYIKRLDSTFSEPNALLNPVEANLLQGIPLCLRGAFLLDTVFRPLVLYSELCMATDSDCELVDSHVAYLNKVLTSLTLGRNVLRPVTHLQGIVENELSETSGMYDLMGQDDTYRSIVLRKLRKSKWGQTYISNIAKVLSITSEALKKGHIDAVKGCILFYAANLKWHIVGKKVDDMLFTAIALSSLPTVENVCVDQLYACGEEIVKTRWLAILDIIKEQNATMNMPSIWTALAESKTVQAFFNEVPFLSKLNSLHERFQNEFINRPDNYFAYVMERDLPKVGNIHSRFISKLIEDMPSLYKNPFIDFDFAEKGFKKQQAEGKNGKTAHENKEDKHSQRFGCPLKIFNSELSDVNKQFQNLIRLAQSENDDSRPDYTNLREIFWPLSFEVKYNPSDIPSMMIKSAVLIECLRDFPLKKNWYPPSQETWDIIERSTSNYIDELAIASVCVKSQEQLRDYFFHLTNSMQKYIPDKGTIIKLLVAFGTHLQAISLHFDDTLFSRGKLRARYVKISQYITLTDEIFDTVSNQNKKIIFRELIERYWRTIKEHDADAYEMDEVLTQEYLQHLHPKIFDKLKLSNETFWELAKKQGTNYNSKYLLTKEIIPCIEFVVPNVPSFTMIKKLVECCTPHVLSSFDMKEHIERNFLKRVIACMFISPDLIQLVFTKEEIILDEMSKLLFIMDFLPNSSMYKIPNTIREMISSHQKKKDFAMFSIEDFFDIDNESKMDNNKINLVENKNLFQWQLFFTNICKKYSAESFRDDKFSEYYSNTCSGSDSLQIDTRRDCFKRFLSRLINIKEKELREKLQYVGLSTNPIE